MARRRGRPRNPDPSLQLRVTFPPDVYDLLGTVARVEGDSRSGWVRRVTMRELRKHGERAARL